MLVGRINDAQMSTDHSVFPNIEVGFRIATVTPAHHPLKLAVHWGSWQGQTPAGRCELSCESEATNYRSHIVGFRFVQTTSAGSVQPRLSLGLSHSASRSGRGYSMIDLGAGLGYRAYPNLLILVSAIRYQPIVRLDSPMIRQYAVQVGFAVGDFR